MNNNDRRIKKTKKALREALAQLLINLDLSNITIKELTDTADIHRATFYSHYQDIYDLYEQIEESVINEIDSIIVSDPTHSYNEHFIAIVNYAYENASICKMLMNGSRNHFQKRISQLLEDNKSVVSQEMRYFTTYHIQGCLSLIYLWVKNNFIYPKEDILYLLCQLNNHIEKIMTQLSFDVIFIVQNQREVQLSFPSRWFITI